MDFLVPLDRRSTVPLHAQLEGQIRDAVQRGRLHGGVELPSTRTLAQELGVARGVIVEGYAQLRAEGYLQVRRRGKTFIAHVARPPEDETQARPKTGQPLAYDFHPGLPELDGFPRVAWTRSLRSAIKDLPGSALAYGRPSWCRRAERGLGRSSRSRPGRGRGV
ncbi:MAG: GntR family transcriptional regulator [Solirubrobacterales bacterium]